MGSAQKGASLEELVRTYFAKQGFFALRGVSFRFDDEEVTDVDVWLYGRQSASVRLRAIVDVKDKRSPKAFERVLWTLGMQLALGVDRAIVATTETNPKVFKFAQQQKVTLLSKNFLAKLSKSLDTPERMTAEEFNDCLKKFVNHKQDGDWIKKISDAKSAVVSLPGYPAFNKAISSFSFFAERIETRSHYREQSLRCALFAASLACIALDSALERSVYEGSPEKYDAIIAGVTYGDTGDARVQSSISRVLSIISSGMDNGKVISRQVENSILNIFSSIRSDVIAEHFVREHNSASLFSAARELEEKSHSVDLSSVANLSTEAKSILGVYADFARVKRGLLFNYDANFSANKTGKGLSFPEENKNQNRTNDRPPLPKAPVEPNVQADDQIPEKKLL